VLYFLDLPNQGFSIDYAERQVKHGTLENTGIEQVANKDSEVINLQFQELERAAYSQQSRDFYQGQIGRIKGQFIRSKTDNVFTLFRWKMTCCAADGIPLMVRIVSPVSIADLNNDQWVEVTGQIQFRKLKERDEYVPVLQLRSRNDVAAIDPPSNPYLQ
jgi:uncharacterized membrane protein YcgQ (UPF0703/DUF1980 family)